MAVTFIVLPTGDTRSFNQRNSSRGIGGATLPFLIYVPDDHTELPDTQELSEPPSESEESSPEETQSSGKQGVTTVEIVRSLEVNVNDTNFRVAPSDSGDLLFSDTDSQKKTDDTPRHAIERNRKKNNRVKYRRIKASAILPLTSDENDDEDGAIEKEIDESDKKVKADGLDFNSRILLSNILIRKSKEDLEDSKYNVFSDPKVSGNKYHATYVNQNGTLAVNKSRLNVKFPPKMFPFKNPTASQIKQNKTVLPSKQISQTQKELYRSRFGKQTKNILKTIQIQNVENSDIENPVEQTTKDPPETKEKQHAITHWDFGRKTKDGVKHKKTTTMPSTTSTISTSTNVAATHFPNIIHPTRNTDQPVEVTTPKYVTNNVIKQHIRPQNALPYQSVVQTVFPNQIPPSAFPKQQTIFQSSFPAQQGVIQNVYPSQQNVQSYNSANSVQGLNVAPVVTKVGTQTYQVIHTNGNVFRQNLGPQLFPSPDFDNSIRGGAVNDASAGVLTADPSQRVSVSSNGQKQQKQESEQQRPVADVRNWQPVYFVPHITLPHHQQQFPVLAFHTVDNRGATQTIPVIVQPNTRATNLVNPSLYSTNIVPPRHTIPAQNGLIYEGLLLTYPQDVQGEPSDIVPILIT
ncbi:uncharacterized protein [Periplaneta americana]|uniref:uncharacterized protein n=1 Tax=Periplaneta americana TaxID=6978 RepID=UPI0037E9C9A5